MGPHMRIVPFLIAVAALWFGGLLSAQQRPAALLETLPVKGQVHLIANPEGNAVVQLGPQGVLVVDTMREQDSAALLATIRSVAGDRAIRYIVNTHPHATSTGGNLRIAEAGAQIVGGNFLGQLGAAGAGRAFIVAHENTLTALSQSAGGAPAMPFAAWPTNTFFQEQKDMYFNGEGVQLVHVPKAHSTGDILVFFRSSDVIATGDLFSTTSFPTIDRAAGGHVNGVIEGLNRIIDLAISEMYTEGGTRIVPSRGRICDEFDVVEYRDMVTIVRDRVQTMIKKGMTLDQIKAARPTLDFETRYGTTTGPWTTAMFVDAVYQGLR